MPSDEGVITLEDGTVLEPVEVLEDDVTQDVTDSVDSETGVDATGVMLDDAPLRRIDALTSAVSALVAQSEEGEESEETQTYTVAVDGVQWQYLTSYMDGAAKATGFNVFFLCLISCALGIVIGNQLLGKFVDGWRK